MHFMLPLRPAAILCMPSCICQTVGSPVPTADQFPSLMLNLLTGSQRDLDLQLSLIAAEVKIPPRLALKLGPLWTQSYSFVFPFAEFPVHQNLKKAPN